MNLQSIAQAMFTQQREVRNQEVTYRDTPWHINEQDGGFHITNDGNRDQCTSTVLTTPAIAVHIADRNGTDDMLYDLSSVTADDFDLASALAGTSKVWKLLEIVVQNDGLITLAFMNVRGSYGVDADSCIFNSQWETVTLNADLERLLMLVETEGGKRQFVIHQEYCLGECAVTTITEICDGLKVSRLYADGGTNDETELPLWFGVLYAPEGNLPADTSPQHHTDQPGA